MAADLDIHLAGIAAGDAQAFTRWVAGGEPPLRAALADRALTPAVAAISIRPVPPIEYPRLRGAAALVTAPAFAAPVVA